MKRWIWPVLACVMVAVFVLGLADASWAQFQQNTTQTGTSSGADAKWLTEDLYCRTKGLIEGPTGLLVGMAMAALGVWALIRGAGIFPALVLIIAGSLITAVPGFVENSMTSVGMLLSEAQITNGTMFSPPGNCSSMIKPKPAQEPAVDNYYDTCDPFEDEDCAEPIYSYGMF